MSSFFLLLRKRYLQDPCPYYTDRIAFIDQWFISMWVRDYAQFEINPKKWKFTESYLNLTKGLLPKDQQTNKKWLEDVDNLLLVHQINTCHWIMLDVDLVTEKIDCYDSIMGAGTPEQDKNLLEKCRVFTRMIPALLNEVIPPKV